MFLNPAIDRGRQRDGRSAHPLWLTWSRMLSRCYRPKAHNYRWYGVRGITVCQEWRSDFFRFAQDMGERPNGCTLDRIDNDGPYNKHNCRWATQEEQTVNSSRSMGYRRLDDSRISIHEMARILLIPHSTLHRHLSRRRT